MTIEASVEIPAYFDPPKQERSRETYRRILAAAEELLRERSFEATSVTEIVARAGCSEGPFYARFGDKEGLLHHMEARLSAARRDVMDDVVAWSTERVGATRTKLLRSLRAVIGLYREHRGIYRALVLRSRMDTHLRDRLRESDRDLLRKASECLEEALFFSREGGEERGRVVLFAARSAIRERVLFGESWNSGTDASDEALAAALADLILACLETESHA